MTDSPPPTPPTVAATTIDDLRRQIVDLRLQLAFETHMCKVAERTAYRAELAVARAEARADSKQAQIAGLEAMLMELEGERRDNSLCGDRPDDPAHLLRRAAAHCRHLAKTMADVDTAKNLTGTGQSAAGKIDRLHLRADTLDAVADVLLGDLHPLYAWLPSHEWTMPMQAAIGVSGTEPGS